ncbi:MAG TPA: phosphatase PAP2 family protein [Blastocatellia bacterium]|nr:phosphatase PAP2 family protein [Blastocatellia bacterium]
MNTRILRMCGRIGIALMITMVTAGTGAAQVPVSEPSPTPPVSSDDSSATPTTTAPPQIPTADSLPKPPMTPASSAKPAPSLEKRFIGNIFRDQRAILTSPLRLQGSDVKFLLPLGLVTGGLIATDRRTANELIDNGGSPNRVRISNNIGRIGAFYGVSSIAGTMYLFGRATHSARLRETGLLGAQAVIDGGIVVTLLKSAAQRTRPTADNGRGDFLDGGSSFPSGHATVSWALATIVAHEYKDHRVIGVGAYGVAAIVGVSRFTGRNHFLSDVLVGSAMGYGIGRYVYRRHHDPSLDPTGSAPSSNAAGSLTGSKLFPWITPHYDRASSTYGLKLSWGL